MEAVVRCLTEVEPLDVRLLDKVVAPGRVRDTVERLVEEALSDPRGADGLLRRGLREARYLHSRERRAVADAVADLVRWLPVLSAAAGEPGDVTAGWLQWLALRGAVLDNTLSADAFAEWLAAEVAQREPVDAAAWLGHLTPALATELVRSVDVPAYLAASGERAPVVLRVNRRLGSRDELARLLAKEDIETVPCDDAIDGLVVQGRPNLRGSRLAQRGWFEVQDEASQQLVDRVDASGPVIDWCAGAGGKSLAVASRFPEATLLSLDVRSHALDETRRRAERAGAKLRTAVHGRRAQNALRDIGPAATVLVDAPCSGSGVWRRHPAWRLSVDAARLEELASLQRQVLREAATAVRPGGRLIYATCSVLRCENEDVVEAFVGSDFRLVEQQRWPVGPTDGFFAATLERVS